MGWDQEQLSVLRRLPPWERLVVTLAAHANMEASHAAEDLLGMVALLELAERTGAQVGAVTLQAPIWQVRLTHGTDELLAACMQAGMVEQHPAPRWLVRPGQHTTLRWYSHGCEVLGASRRVT